MPKVSGIQIEKNNKGVYTKLHIDLKKFAEDDDIIHFLNKNGFSTKNANDNYLSLNEVKKQTSKYIHSLNWKK